jgi:aminoglycoside phosphotransferase (APT) family kinase protein
MRGPLDETRPVRAGEELSLERLQSYLRQHVPDGAGTLRVEQFPHGHSNLTYLVSWGGHEWVLRRPPFGNVVKSAHDMGREFRVLSKLHAMYPPAPRPLIFCDDDTVLGAPFYLMERRRGIIFRKSPPAGWSLDPNTMRQLCVALIDNLARLHALDYRAAGLGELGKPDGYVARQVHGWSKRYRDAQTDAVPELDRVIDWLTSNMPPESGAAVIHNDFKFDNLLFDPNDLTRVVAVLDWEMATVGDPLMDLGSALGYWVQPGDPDMMQEWSMGPTSVPGSLTRRELVERYAELTSRNVSNIVFYHCFGLFKIAVIIQQIYARYVRGHTRDERFAQMNRMVSALAAAANRVVQTQTL